jgi:hypothetical protein
MYDPRWDDARERDDGRARVRLSRSVPIHQQLRSSSTPSRIISRCTNASGSNNCSFRTESRSMETALFEPP